MEIRAIIRTYKACGLNASETARRLGIDRRTVKFWVKAGYMYRHRFTWMGLTRRSTQPHTIHRAIGPKVEAKIVNLRQVSGYDCRKLAYQVGATLDLKVSPSSIYRQLKLRYPHLLRPTRRYLRPRFQDSSHMRPSNTTTPGYLQADVKYVTPELSGLPYTTYEYGLIDIYSRYKLALILPVLDEAGAILTLKWVLKQHPFSVKGIQTDNGLEFQSQFHVFCQEIGIAHYYIHKRTPNENAVIERSFRIDQEEFFFRLDTAPQDINELNNWLQKYLLKYNQDRPHFSLNLKTPSQVLRDFFVQ